MRHSIVAAAVLIASLSFSARAEEHRPDYSGQLMFTDMFSSMSYLLSTATPGNPSYKVGGLVGFAIGGPAIHFAHQRPMHAVASLALRIGLSVAGGFITARTIHDQGRGMALGAVTAMLTDALVLSRF